MSKLPLVISFYTKETLYEKEAENLVKSCEKLGLEHAVEGVPSLGKWEHNCCFKPQFILRMLEKTNRPLLWIDADGELLKEPSLFHAFEPDLATCINHDLPIAHPSRVISNTVFVNNTARGARLLRHWIERCQQALNAPSRKKEIWDQECLRDAIYYARHRADVRPLPPSYTAIYDKTELTEDEIHIVHYQASRLLKKFVNGEVAPLKGMESEASQLLKEMRVNFYKLFKRS